MPDECTALVSMYQLEGQPGDPSVSLVYNVLITSNGSQLVVASGNVEVPVTATSGRISTDQALTEALTQYAEQNHVVLTSTYVLPEWRLL